MLGYDLVVKKIVVNSLALEQVQILAKTLKQFGIWFHNF